MIKSLLRLGKDMITNWKYNAKKSIKGNIGILFVISLIISIPSLFNLDFADLFDNLNKIFELFGLDSLISNELITFVSIVGFFSSIVYIFVMGPFTLSEHYVYLNVAKNNYIEVVDSFYGFKDYWASVKLYFLMTIYTFLWSMLFLIPGIIKGYAYSMAPYILAENPGMSARECIKKSVEITTGNKANLFFLDLSFIGWNILVLLTGGILGIWIVPYYKASKAHAYLDIEF